MTIWEGSIRIAAPPASVFDYVIDRRNYHRWFPGIVRMIPADDLPIDAPDKCYDEIAIGPDNKEIEVKVETLDVTPKTQFSMKADLWPIRPRFSYSFGETVNGETLMSIRSERGSLNPLAFLGSVVMRRILARRGPEALERLKAIIERDETRTMCAAEFRQFGAPADVVECNALAPRPQAGNGQILVRVSASSINPIEPKRVRGYGAAMLRFKGGTEWPITLGADFAGEVAAVGPGVSGFAVGERVFGVKDIGSRGTHAEFTVVDVANARKIPERVDTVRAAALPYAWMTGWSALVKDCGIDRTQGRLLVRGASGGTGMAAILLARSMDWSVDGVCKSDARDMVKKLGAEVIFAYDKDELWPTGRYDIVLDCVGDPDFAQVRAALSSNGMRTYASLVHPTLALGDKHGALPGLLRAKRQRRRLARSEQLNIKWSAFSSDPTALDALQSALPTISNSIAIDRSFPFADIVSAYAHVESGSLRGKVIIDNEG